MPDYTFSKNIDTASRVPDSFQIPWQFANIERAISSIDRPHLFNIGWVYELLLGKGKRKGGSPQEHESHSMMDACCRAPANLAKKAVRRLRGKEQEESIPLR